jgi:hypothetical protein
MKTFPAVLIQFLFAVLVNYTFVSAAVIPYEEDVTNFCNPDRGTFPQAGALAASTLLNNRRTKGETLEMVYCHLGPWKHTDVIPQSFFDSFNKSAAAAREAGCRMIPRFVYTMVCTTAKVPDAPLSRILLHIKQLAPLLQANSDVIAHVQAGLIGPWGEWHHFECTNPYDLDNTSTRSQVLSALLDAIPNRQVAVRYPYAIMDIYGNSPLGPDSAPIR